MSKITTDGYAPPVPSYVDIPSANIETLILIVRDGLQNGANPTRANLAMRYLVEKLNLESTFTKLDEEPYLYFENTLNEHRSAAAREVNENDDSVEYGSFRPRYGFSQNEVDYKPKPTEMGWYPDPDGSGQERWWMGTMWADSYRTPEKKPGGKK